MRQAGGQRAAWLLTWITVPLHQPHLGAEHSGHPLLPLPLKGALAQAAVGGGGRRRDVQEERRRQAACAEGVWEREGLLR